MRKQLLSTRRVGWAIGFGVVGVWLLAAFACSAPNNGWARRGDPVNSEYRNPAGYRWREQEYPRVEAAIPKLANAELIKDDEICMTCHESYVKYHKTNIHRGQSCENCHGPASQHVKTRGKEPGTILSFKTMKPAERSEVCLQCHSQDACSPGEKWRSSAHAHAGVACTDCHKGHYNVPPGTPSTLVAVNVDGTNPIKLAAAQAQQPKKEDVDMAAIKAASNMMGAAGAQTCYKCHQDKSELSRVAHPHQIGGKNAFECNTCHDPHGQIKAETRKDLCLKCHTGHPTTGFQSSIHAMSGVACVDCHNPHPTNEVMRDPDIRHWSVNRTTRLPMAVQQPEACYKCHVKIANLFQMPSHHPVLEGKMTCSDCHSAHGEALGNLNQPTLNLVCYKCHTDKQGPFVYQHPPVEENCAICHNPHGTVANNLLKQPTTFLCLRCHSGHRGQRRNIATVPSYRAAFYTDCAQCHPQIHGSNLPPATRTGPKFTR